MSVDPSAVTAASPGAASSEPSETPVEHSVGKYRLDHLLGAGGMGLVWAAFDPDLERRVAVKLLRQDATAPEMRTRLLREARAMARLRHPNVVTVFDVGTDRGRDYIAMELVEGGTLDDWLQTKPPQREIIDALIAAGRGLAAAHGAGLVHRDFKPHNILRDKTGAIFVTDFGLARGQIESGPELVRAALPLEAKRRDDFLDSTLTQTGVLIGTPAYMAPEQFGGSIPDHKSDQFAFCVTAWQALAGERPFRGASVGELELATKAGVSKLVADLPMPLRVVLERGLDPEPGNRWPSMDALLEALAAAREPAKRRRWLVPAIVGAAALCAGGVTIAIVAFGGDDDGCEPAEQAFAKAWSQSKRDQLRGRIGVGPLVVLDNTKRAWMRSYAQACEVHDQPKIRCLLDVRDDIARVVSRIQGDGEIEMAEIASQTAGLYLCDPDAFRGFGPGRLPPPRP